MFDCLVIPVLNSLPQPFVDVMQCPLHDILKTAARETMSWTDMNKGRTIRKLIGGEGAGEVQKNYSRKGILKEKKFMHAN